jgi:flavodoxin
MEAHITRIYQNIRRINKSIKNNMRKLTFLAIAMIALAIAPLSLGAANPNKILIAYFSWGGNTETVANYIANQTQGELFRIEPVVPYPSEYTPCTEVALEERDTNARPAIKDKVANWDDYDVIFIGCPVWWHEAPMIIHTFAESYDFAGKTVVPFCTYASTYRDETLAKIVEITPAADHLEGFGARSSSTSGVTEWLNRIGMIPGNSGINDVAVDNNANITVYNTTGNVVYDGIKSEVFVPQKGIYIVRSDNKTEKVVL